MTVATGDRDALRILQARLEAHFHELGARRRAAVPGSPVFALEHGLTEAELALLRSEVGAAVRRRSLPRDTWLPFVIYGAEIGYEFCGDQYWQTFSARTAGWADLGDPARQYMRQRFRDFRDTFGGAEPTGAWAAQFSIICWPITHAVLPTDLQRHLARLLFDFRRSITWADLDDPDELGRRLAARAWQTSVRFQTFAQNTHLLGQVAAALLIGDEDDSPYLLHSTLTRIVEDLSKERQAQRWLEDAKHTAQRVRTRGFSPADGRRSAPGTRREYVASTDPILYTREGSDGWALYLELPDLTPLSERLPSMREELAGLRPLVSGASRRFARGHLLFPGQLVRATTWPQRGTPVIQLDRGSEVVNDLLAEHCIMSPGPQWLFRIRTPSHGIEVRRKFVRPSHTYVLFSESTYSDPPNWASPVRASTDAIAAYILRVPDVLDHSDLDAITHLGLGVVTDVQIRPIGYVPASWDGEGTAEWLEGEDPLVGIRSDRSIAQCVLAVGEVPALIPWPQGEREIIVRLTDLKAGTHNLHVSLAFPGDNVVSEGALDVVIRPPRTQLRSGTPGEALMILASPASPTLTELWDGQGVLELVGPPATKARFVLEFLDRTGRRLLERSTSVLLPRDRATWTEFFASRFRRMKDVHRYYERAEVCIATLSAPGLGAASVRCERPFTALRWAIAGDSAEPHLTLIDNTGEGVTTVTRYEFDRPADAHPTPLDEVACLRVPRGGLVVAMCRASRAAVIAPPIVHSLEDLRSPSPSMPTLRKTPHDVLRVIELSELWASASLPANPVAEARRLDVLRCLARVIATLIGGPRWADVENLSLQTELPDPRLLRQAIGDRADHRRLSSALVDALPSLSALDIAGRTTRFAELLAREPALTGVSDQDRPTAEFLLRLASEPATLRRFDQGTLDAGIGRALGSPILVRAARFVVLGTIGTDDDSAVYAGWSWE